MRNHELSFKNVNENPCKMCMPMGGILALKGVEQSMVIVHGSQGCATYMRRHIAEHFNEPVDVASSSLNEKGTIYGGEKNLKQGIDNLIKLYRPKLIGILTTCLAETIGEDIERIAAEYLIEQGMETFPLVTAPTPGYGDSHSEGFILTARRVVEKLARPVAAHKKVNVIVPNISPADIREIKRILALTGVEFTIFPDFSDTLDQPFSRPYKKIPTGGTKLEDIAAMPGAPATIQFGATVDDRVSPGEYLYTNFSVPLYNLPIPTGLENTDLFLNTLAKITGNPVPESLVAERGRLLDAMIDAHKITFQGSAAIYGEPEQVYAITLMCLENGITPAVSATGSRNNRLKNLLEPLLSPREGTVLTRTDFDEIRTFAKEKGANLAIGNSDGKYLTEQDGIPLVRLGFPIHDRKGGQRLLSVGYAGTTDILDKITNTLLEQKLVSYRGTMYRTFYRDTVPEAGCGEV